MSAPTATATITPPLIPTATATEMATAVPTQGVTFEVCNPQVNATANRDGDLYVSDAMLTGLSYPSYQVPDNTPLKPLQVSLNSQTPFGRQADTNPNLSPHSGGYQIIICNGSKSQSHTIESVSARLGAFTAYGGQLNAWNVCQEAYDNQSGQAGGGCGGAYFADYYLLASFAPDAAVGTIVTTSVGSSNTGNPPPLHTAPLPVVLAPNQAITVEVGMKPPTAAGSYTFDFGLGVDSATTTFVSVGPPTLLAPTAHTWSGQACETPAMKAQIPTSPHADYICPDA